MKIHRRTPLVQKANNELCNFLISLEQKHRLTIGEILTMLGDAVSRFARYQVRADRHPNDPDKKGDEA